MQENVGMIAINDAVLMESLMFLLLKTSLRTHPRYISLVELFHDVIPLTQTPTYDIVFIWFPY